MADPDDLNTIISLYKSAMSYFREKNVAVVRCCLTDKRFAKLLKRFLFFRDFLKQDPVMLTNLEKCTHADLLKDIHNWHVTCSASDEIMLEAMVKP
jgi:hypothetical protein